MCYCIVSVEVGVIVKNEEQCAIGKNERKFSNFSKKVTPYPPREVRRRWIDWSLTENRVLPCQSCSLDMCGTVSWRIFYCTPHNNKCATAPIQTGGVSKSDNKTPFSVSNQQSNLILTWFDVWGTNFLEKLANEHSCCSPPLSATIL